MAYIYTLCIGSHRTLKRGEVLRMLAQALSKIAEKGGVHASIAGVTSPELLLQHAHGRVRRGYGKAELFVYDERGNPVVIEVEHKLPKEGKR